MAQHFIGQDGDFTFGANTYSVLTWSGDEETKEIDTTSTGDGGFSTNITGVYHFAGTAEMCADSDALQITPLMAGQQGALQLEVGNTGKSFEGTANLTKASVKNPAEDKVTFSVSFVFTGEYTRPN